MATPLHETTTVETDRPRSPLWGPKARPRKDANAPPLHTSARIPPTRAGSWWADGSGSAPSSVGTTMVMAMSLVNPEAASSPRQAGQRGRPVTAPACGHTVRSAAAAALEQTSSKVDAQPPLPMSSPPPPPNKSFGRATQPGKPRPSQAVSKGPTTVHLSSPHSAPAGPLKLTRLQGPAGSRGPGPASMREARSSELSFRGTRPAAGVVSRR